jgi:hypothetical protein
MPTSALLPDPNRNFRRFALEPNEDAEPARDVRIFSGNRDSRVSLPGSIDLRIEVNAHNPASFPIVGFDQFSFAVS